MALSARQIAIKQKKILMQLELLEEDSTVDPKGLIISQINKDRCYKGTPTKSYMEEVGAKFGVYVCKAGRKGIYNT